MTTDAIRGASAVPLERIRALIEDLLTLAVENAADRPEAARIFHDAAGVALHEMLVHAIRGRREVAEVITADLMARRHAEGGGA